jgi:hypothetical protein
VAARVCPEEQAPHAGEREQRQEGQAADADHERRCLGEVDRRQQQDGEG